MNIVKQNVLTQKAISRWRNGEQIPEPEPFTLSHVDVCFARYGLLPAFNLIIESID